MVQGVPKLKRGNWGWNILWARCVCNCDDHVHECNLTISHEHILIPVQSLSARRFNDGLLLTNRRHFTVLWILLTPWLWADPRVGCKINFPLGLSLLTKTNFVLGLVSLDCRLRLLDNFSGSFSKRNGFIFPLRASRTCSMPRQDFFASYLLPSHVKYYLSSQNFPLF